MWGNDVSVNLLSKSLHHIDVYITLQNMTTWRLSGVYDWPDDYNKHMTWELLQKLYSSPQMPWLYCGDFNEVLFSKEKKRGLLKSFNKMERLR